MRLAALLLLVASVSAYSLASERVDGNRLVGTWQLVSFVVIDKQGQEQDWCKDAHGLLTYTNEGYMSAAINCSLDTPAGAPSKKYSDMLVYAGTYDLGNGDILHNVLNASVNDFIGKRAVRHVVELTDRSLVLSGNFGGPFRISWKRAKRHSR